MVFPALGGVLGTGTSRVFDESFSSLAAPAAYALHGLRLRRVLLRAVHTFDCYCHYRAASDQQLPSIEGLEITS